MVEGQRRRPILADITEASLAGSAIDDVQPRPGKRTRTWQESCGVQTVAQPPTAPSSLLSLDAALLSAAVTPASQLSRSFFSDGQECDARVFQRRLSAGTGPCCCTCKPQQPPTAEAVEDAMDEDQNEAGCCNCCLGCGEELMEQTIFKTPGPNTCTAPPLGVVDIDNMEILSELPESRAQGYMREYHSYLRARELEGQPSHDYLETTQRGLMTRSMRTILVSWLYEVAHEYDLMPSTLYMTISLIDRGLSRVFFDKDQLQCMGVTCLFMACKFEEVKPPELKEFSYMTDDSVSKNEIVATERVVAGALHFVLQTVTPYCFIHRFTRAAGSMQKEQALAHYLSELMLLEYWPLQYKPSLRAAAALNLARQTLMRPKAEIWNLAIQHYTGYEARELESCVRQLAKLHSSADLEQHFEVVRKKFDSGEACHVSEIPAIRESELVFV